MNEGRNIISQITTKKQNPFWTQRDLVDYIGKPVEVDMHGMDSLNGTYSIAELEAIIICAAMEKGTFRG